MNRKAGTFLPFTWTCFYTDHPAKITKLQKSQTTKHNYQSAPVIGVAHEYMTISAERSRNISIFKR